MTRVIDVWRAVDPDARLASGSVDLLDRAVRGVSRTRAAPPHLPPAADGHLLVVDAALVGGGHLDPLLAAIDEAGLLPAAVALAGVDHPAALERAGHDLPLMASSMPAASLADGAAAYLERESEMLTDVTTSLRLAGAEAALAEPRPSAPAGVVAARLRRGVAVAVEGRLEALNPRPAGHALAGRFAATFARLAVAGETRDGVARRTRDGLWLLERRVDDGVSAWLFDDVPFARIDEVALEALTLTLRALLRRAAPSSPRIVEVPRQPPVTGDTLRDTLLAVARANGRVAVAARSLGVHRNTVLYRLRRARAEQGIDPRRPDDALRLLQEADRRGT